MIIKIKREEICFHLQCAFLKIGSRVVFLDHGLDIRWPGLKSRQYITSSVLIIFLTALWSVSSFIKYRFIGIVTNKTLEHCFSCYKKVCVLSNLTLT